MELKPCVCGCTDIYHVIDGNTTHIECAECNRHTRPFFNEEDAEAMWNDDKVEEHK